MVYFGSQLRTGADGWPSRLASAARSARAVGLPRRLKHARHMAALRALVRYQSRLTSKRRDVHHILHRGSASCTLRTSAVLSVRHGFVPSAALLAGADTRFAGWLWASRAICSWTLPPRLKPARCLLHPPPRICSASTCKHVSSERGPKPRACSPAPSAGGKYRNPAVAGYRGAPRSSMSSRRVVQAGAKLARLRRSRIVQGIDVRATGTGACAGLQLTRRRLTFRAASRRYAARRCELRDGRAR